MKLETLHFYLLLVGMAVVGYLVARVRYRRLLWEQQQVHMLCEDAAYQAGRERGRSECVGLSENTQAWYKRGFKDGERKGLIVGRREAEARMNALGLAKN